MKRTIVCQGGKKIAIKVTPEITKAAKKAIQDLVQFALGHKLRATASLEPVEELLALHGIGFARSFVRDMKETILADAAYGGSKKAYAALARSKSGRNMIEQLKIRKP